MVDKDSSAQAFKGLILKYNIIIVTSKKPRQENHLGINTILYLVNDDPPAHKSHIFLFRQTPPFKRYIC
ncbi:UNVERIFIED_CONTAM: hypothetical protein Cloal_0394 [Acetivibrio alkalicellulosi]